MLDGCSRRRPDALAKGITRHMTGEDGLPAAAPDDDLTAVGYVPVAFPVEPRDRFPRS